MESDFGPSVLKHTFGCALLSAYPIVESQQLVLPSPEVYWLRRTHIRLLTIIKG